MIFCFFLGINVVEKYLLVVLPYALLYYKYTLIVSILGVVAKRFSQSSGIFVYTPVAQSVCAYPKNETLWV
jgi:hypothetical protein